MSMYQKLVKNLLYPIDCLRDRRIGELRWTRDFEKSQFLSRDEIQKLAWERLINILNYANEHIPFYINRFAQAGVIPREISSMDDLLAIPPLEKRELQSHRDELLDPNWPKNDLLLDKTGGSTGTPVEYYRSMDRHYSRAAATHRHNRWAGWDIGDRSMAIWGAARDCPPIAWRSRFKNRLFGQGMLFNTGGFKEEDFLAFHNEMKRFRPKAILAYAQAVAVLARILRDNNISAYSPYSIITTAEMLSPENRLLIEEVFQCHVFNRYGCREVSVIASECTEHNGLHIMAEGLYLEVVNESGHVAPGEVGEILITDMLNYPMPLIRYRVGDMGAWAKGDCPCGRGLPRLERIAGRVTDFLLGVDGRLCSGAVLTLVVGTRPSLGQVQIIQKEIGTVRYRIASGKETPPSDEDLDFLRQETAKYLGKGMIIEFEYVDYIPHEPSGKYLFTKSSVLL